MGADAWEVATTGAGSGCFGLRCVTNDEYGFLFGLWIRLLTITSLR